MASVAELASSRELLTNLTLRDLRSQYKRSTLGWAWSLLNPLATMAIYTLVFGMLLKVAPPVGDPSGLRNFALFLLCGLLPWTFFSGTVSTSIESLIGNSNLIKKVYFPREVLVASTVFALDVTFLIELGLLSTVLLLFGNMVLPWLPVALVIVAVQTVFVLGVGLTLAVLNVYFRDIKHLVTILLQFLFYATPIVYPVALVPKRAMVLGLDVPVRFIYRMNPMVRFVEAYRDCLYNLRFPSLETTLYLAFWASFSFVVGVWMFGKFEPRLAEEL